MLEWNAMQVAQLITRLLESGRAATDDEIRQLREHVAQAGFDPDARERVRGRGAGAVWRGRVLKGSDMLPPAEAHYVRHVLRRPEWPADTMFEDYLRSTNEVVTSPSGGVFLSLYGDHLQVGFIARSGGWQGEEGGEWILVDFRVDIDHITTAYQISTPEQVFTQPRRSNSRWLKRPTY